MFNVPQIDAPTTTELHSDIYNGYTPTPEDWKAIDELMDRVAAQVQNGPDEPDQYDRREALMTPGEREVEQLREYAGKPVWYAQEKMRTWQSRLWYPIVATMPESKLSHMYACCHTAEYLERDAVQCQHIVSDINTVREHREADKKTAALRLRAAIAELRDLREKDYSDPRIESTQQIIGGYLVEMLDLMDGEPFVPGEAAA